MNCVATVYLVTNMVNEKRYVGVTRFTVHHRWVQHCYSASIGKRTRLYSAIRKYGHEAFCVQAVASCLLSPHLVERDVIFSLRPEYNQTNGGEITKGRRLSPETIAKIAAANRGKKRTLEQNSANSARKRAQYAANPELLEIVRANAYKGLSAVDQEKQKATAGASAKSRIWSEESKAKLSASCMGRVYSKDVVAKSAAKKCVKIECQSLGMTFSSMLEASRALGISNSYIGKVCAGKALTAGGYKFRYAKL